MCVIPMITVFAPTRAVIGVEVDHSFTNFGYRDDTTVRLENQFSSNVNEQNPTEGMPGLLVNESFGRRVDVLIPNNWQDPIAHKVGNKKFLFVVKPDGTFVDSYRRTGLKEGPKFNQPGVPVPDPSDGRLVFNLEQMYFVGEQGDADQAEGTGCRVSLHVVKWYVNSAQQAPAGNLNDQK